MKRYNYFILLSVICLSACSGKERINLLEQISETVQGKYNCTSMIWEGEPIDLDEDGTPSVDLFKEFQSYDFARTAFTNPSRVEKAMSFNKENIIQLEIPLQSIKYDKRAKEYSLMNWLSGDRSYLFFAYAVHEDGTIAFSTKNDMINKEHYRDSKWETAGVEYPTTNGVSIQSLVNGTLSVQMVGTYYDFISQKIKTGKVNLTYERISYSVN